MTAFKVKPTISWFKVHRKKCLYSLVFLIIYLAFVFFCPPLYTRYIHPTLAIESAEKLNRVVVEYDNKDYELTLLGYLGAKQFALEKNWSKILVVKIAAPSGTARVERFPVPHLLSVTHYFAGNDLATRDAQMNNSSAAMGRAELMLSTPGFFGSSGPEEYTYTVEGIQIIASALEKLVNEFNAETIVLEGGSHGGNIVAGLLSYYKGPIRCAIISAAPLDIHSPYTKPIHDLYARTSTPFDPMARVKSISTDEQRQTFIAYSRMDRIVDWRITAPFAKKMKAQGHNVIESQPPPIEFTYFHDHGVWAWQTIKKCVDSWEKQQTAKPAE